MHLNQVPWLSAWEAQGEKMVVLGVETSTMLNTLMEQAQTKTLLVHTVFFFFQTQHLFPIRSWMQV